MADSVVKYSYNGTEYSFVSKDPAQIEDLKCPICLELVYEPVLTSCGHLFCQRCVRDQIKCPTCRDELRYMCNQRDERKVKCLKVKCPNWEKGCQWQGNLGDSAQHTGAKCPVEIIPCSRGCKETVFRGHVDQHAKTCTMRVYKCPHCWFENTFVSVTTVHFTECEGLPLICPAGCCSYHSRASMGDHLAVCTEELVACNYVSVGCTEEVKRKQLKTHLELRKDLHLKEAMEKVEQLSMDLATVRTTVWSLASGAKPDISHLPLPMYPWLQNTPTCYPRPPWVIKVDGFQERKETDVAWFSDPVYSHFGGYKMGVRVHTNGSGQAKGAYVSVYIYLMRGDNDDNLKWPFRGTIEVSLLNQLMDGQHLTKQLWSPPDVGLHKPSQRVTEGERARFGHGQSKFISHQKLRYCGSKNRQFLKDNALFLRVDCFEPKLWYSY